MTEAMMCLIGHVMLGATGVAAYGLIVYAAWLIGDTEWDKGWLGILMFHAGAVYVAIMIAFLGMCN